MVSLGQVWLKCRMGLCSATSAGANNVFRYLVGNLFSALSLQAIVCLSLRTTSGIVLLYWADIFFARSGSARYVFFCVCYAENIKNI
jgi:hypothetical protein